MFLNLVPPSHTTTLSSESLHSDQFLHTPVDVTTSESAVLAQASRCGDGSIILMQQSKVVGGGEDGVSTGVIG